MEIKQKLTNSFFFFQFLKSQKYSPKVNKAFSCSLEKKRCFYFIEYMCRKKEICPRYLGTNIIVRSML